MKRIIINREKCDSCLNCTVACISAHQEGSNFYTADLSGRTAESRNKIYYKENQGYFPIFCRHCDEPECVMSCMSGALSKDSSTGLVNYDAEKCGSCLMCVMNCPYGVMKPDKENSKMIKCDFCQDQPEGPSCVKSCPKEAIIVQEV
ncbi:4Fe-4S dicluster domain-containing protein [Eubacteriaceae bacterium ES3]|nr:4Fe-4S dicluster domain-containing protein [Eubacteriaceae bacterium ES3]